MTTEDLTSATVAINSMALLKKQRGEKIYNFAAGDPILPSHPQVIEAVKKCLDTEAVLYPPVAGIGKLRQEACRWVNEVHGCAYREENTLVTAGGKFAIFAALQILLEEGDEVLIPSPYWVSYPQITRLFKGIPVILPTQAENQWKLTPETLKAHLSPRSKILILNNAGNPTGTLYRKEELAALLKAAEEAGLFVISDEVYSEIVYDGHRFFSCGALAQERVLVIQSCSKNFAMTGWRVGFAFGKTDLIRQMTALQSQSTTSPCLVSQWAALAALKNHTEITLFVQDAMQKRRNLFYQLFQDLFQCRLEMPASSIYAFIPLSVFIHRGIQNLVNGNVSASDLQQAQPLSKQGMCKHMADAASCKGEDADEASGQISNHDVYTTQMNSDALCTKLMDKANIACVPGTAFGKEGYLRLAFSETEEAIREGLIALKKATAP